MIPGAVQWTEDRGTPKWGRKIMKEQIIHRELVEAVQCPMMICINFRCSTQVRERTT